MSRVPKRPAESQEAQSERFIAMARELGADESEERFDTKLKKVARVKPASDVDTKPPLIDKK